MCLTGTTGIGNEGVVVGGGGLGFSQINDDVLQNILARLPALPFASAACVSKSWNRVCNRILTRPKLASALSLNPSLHGAVKEVFDKVLAEPIRPQFAIACIGVQFSLEETHKLITEKLGREIPIITNAASGIIGTDARTNELREVKWELEDGPNCEGYNMINNLNRGIVLVVGFVPGLKVAAVPLLRSKETQVGMVDKFVMDIMHYTASVSGCTSPTGIIMFGDQNIDMKPVIAKMDHAMPEETAIVGDASGCFLFRSGDGSHNYNGDLYSFDAVALVFARDREKSHGIGETQFHVTLSTGVMPFGPQLTAQSVRVKGSECWLSASIEGCHEILDGQDLLDDINDVMDHDESPDLYIGVTQHRECSIGPEKLRSATSLSFYEVLGGDNQYFVVDGVGIQPGDSFLFYHSDSETASSSCANVFEDLEALKTGSNCKSHPDIRGVADNGVKKEVFGGFIFSCYLRGESYFGRPNVDSAPFFLNFPSVPLAGLFCTEEIGRDSPGTSMQKEVQEPHFGRCCLHVYSTVYLVMSYVPPPP
ncbi:F-box/LRR-repeat protein At5g63520-like [Fagus crenata]